MTDIPLTKEEQQIVLRTLRVLKRFVDTYLDEEAEIRNAHVDQVMEA